MMSRRTPRARGALVGALIAVALLELVLAGWLVGAMVGSMSGAPASSPIAQPPAPDPIALPSCELAEPGRPPLAGSVYAGPAMSIANPVDHQGLVYLSVNRTLAFGEASSSGMRLVEFTLFGDAAATSTLPVTSSDGLSAGIDPTSPLVVLDARDASLQLVAHTGRDMATASGPVDLRAAGATEASAIDIDPSADAVVLVDPARDEILRFGFRQLPRGSGYVAELTGGCRLRLPVLRDAPVVSMAIRPSDGHLFLAGEAGTVLHELDRAGQPLAYYNLDGLDLTAVRGLTFAPTASLTDDPAALDLYVLDAFEAGGRILPLSFAPPTSPAATDVAANVVNRVDTASLDPISSDPGGVAYDPIGRRILVTDSDIDEIRPHDGHTLFALGEDGSWSGLGSPGGVTEVTDVAVDALGSRWFLTDDHLKLVIVVDLGADGTYDTLDDRISRFSTAEFGSEDPEGIAFGQDSIFVTDGAGSQIYRVSAGPDGVFGGSGRNSDDAISSIDTLAVGVSDPEGIDYDPQRGTLYVRGRDQQEPIVELATNGTLVSRITLPDGELNSPGGIALTPALDGSGVLSLLVADRGEDNADSAVPIDGRLVELHVDWLAGRSVNEFQAALRPVPTESP